MNMNRKNCEFKEEVRRKQHIGQVLRAIRELRHLSCPDIAREYRISYPVIYDYESGRSFPRFHNARELFTALKVDPEIFLKYWKGDKDLCRFQVFLHLCRRNPNLNSCRHASFRPCEANL